MVEGCVALGRLRGPPAPHLSRTSKKGCGYKAVQATLAKRSSAVTGPSSRPKATVKSMVPVQGRAQQEAWGGGLGKASATQAKCRLPAAPCEGVLRMRSCRQWQSTGASSAAPGCSAGPCEPTPDLFSHRERASANSAVLPEMQDRKQQRMRCMRDVSYSRAKVLARRGCALAMQGGAVLEEGLKECPPPPLACISSSGAVHGSPKKAGCARAYCRAHNQIYNYTRIWRRI